MAMNQGRRFDGAGYPGRYINNFITTSRWRPKDEAFAARDGQGNRCAERVSHDHDEALDEVYGIDLWSTPLLDIISRKSHLLKYVPLYCIASSLMNPAFYKKTWYYIELYDIQSVETLLSELSPLAVGGDHFKLGQRYTGIRMQVEKQHVHSIVLSSFEDYNVGNYSFQQKSWMANIGGVPIHAICQPRIDLQIGMVGMDWLDPSGHLTVLQNATNPLIQQDGMFMLVSYKETPYPTSGVVYLYWPAKCFDNPIDASDKKRLPSNSEPLRYQFQNEIVGSGKWLIGKRDGAYIGIYTGHDTWQTYLPPLRLLNDQKLFKDDSKILDKRLHRPEPADDNFRCHFAALALKPGVSLLPIAIFIGDASIGSFEDFYQKRLKKIKIDEFDYMKDSNTRRGIIITDTNGTKLSAPTYLKDLRSNEIRKVRTYK